MTISDVFWLFFSSRNVLWTEKVWLNLYQRGGEMMKMMMVMMMTTGFIFSGELAL